MKATRMVLLVCAAVTGFFLGWPAQTQAAFTFARVIRTGDHAPGTVADKFTTFDTAAPALSGSDLAFTAGFSFKSGIFKFIGGLGTSISLTENGLAGRFALQSTRLFSVSARPEGQQFRG